jgi:hypothetical protein
VMLVNAEPLRGEQAEDNEKPGADSNQAQEYVQVSELHQTQSKNHRFVLSKTGKAGMLTPRTPVCVDTP